MPKASTMAAVINRTGSIKDKRMPEKDPSSYSLLTYAWVIVLSIWGGAVNFYQKVKAGDARPFNFVEFIGEICTSGFAGVITFYLCEAGNFSPLMTAAMVGIAGHMGGRAIFQLERLVATKISNQ